MTEPNDLTDIMESHKRIRKAFSELHKITNGKGKPDCFYLPLDLLQELWSGYGTEQVSCDEWVKTKKELEKIGFNTDF